MGLIYENERVQNLVQLYMVANQLLTSAFFN